VVAEQEHRERGGRLVRHQVTLCYLDAGPARGLGQHVLALELDRDRRSRDPRQARLERVAELVRRSDQVPHPPRAVPLERADDRRVQHRPRFETEFDPARADPADEVCASGEEAEPRSCRSVLVEPGRAGVGAELERLRLAEHRRPDACAPRVVHEQPHVDPPRLGHDLLELLQRERLVRDRQPRQHDERGVALELRRELLVAACVHELPAGEADRTHDDRVRVARRHAEHGVARPHEDLHRRDDGRREPVRDEDVVSPGLAPEVVECELREAVAPEGGSKVVVEQRPVHVADRERALEPREVEQRVLAAALLHDSPRRAELRDVRIGVREERATFVGQGHATSLRSR
jgi:hypothetical protein